MYTRWLLEHRATGLIITEHDHWAGMRAELQRRELPQIERPRGEAVVDPHYRVRQITVRPPELE